MTTSLINELVSSKNKTITGTYDNVTTGHTGTYTVAVTQESNGTVDRLLNATRDDGKTEVKDTVYTSVSATQVTSHTTITQFNGVTDTVDRVYTLNTDGTISITAHRVASTGLTTDVTATLSFSKGAWSVTGSLTQSNGATGTFTDTTTHGAGLFETTDTATIVGTNGIAHTHAIDITGTYA